MIDAILERAQQLIQLARYQDASKELRSALSLEPDNVQAIALLGICQAELNNLDEAAQLIQTAISKAPDNDYYLYLQALILFRKGNHKESEKFIRNAIAFHARNANYYGLLASIKLSQKEWEAALEAANEGLAIDADNLTCLNTRSTALFKLDKKEEAYASIQRALQNDPENEFTHTNIGWGLLERGQHKEALEHFREALKINPNFDAAKAGLVEGLKGRYWFYRLFLRYAFWLSNFQAKMQWAIIIGMYVAIKGLSMVAEKNDGLATFINPIIYLYLAFAISTWVIAPLSNLFLRLNTYGRYALTKDEIKSSNFVGIAFAIGVVSGILFLLKGDMIYFFAMMFGISMMIPLGSMFNPSKEKSKWILVGCAILLAVIGVALLVQVAVTGTAGLWLIYVFGLIGYQLVTNAMVIK